MKTILILSGNADHRTTFAALLRHAGYETHPVSTAKAAIRQMDYHLPHALVVDLNAPDDYADVFDYLCRNQLMRRLYLTLLTNDAATISNTSLGEMAEIILTKPVSESLFVSTLHDLLTSRRTREFGVYMP